MRLVRAAVSLATLAKLLRANLLRDSIRRAPRRTFLGAGITPAVGLGFFRLALGLLLLSVPLVHDSFDILQVKQKRARRFRDCGVHEVVLILPRLWHRSKDDAGKFTIAKNHVALYSGGYRLRAVVDGGQMGDVVVQHAHTRHVLPDRDSLWLAYHLLHVETLLFSCISRQYCELVELNAVRQRLSGPHTRTIVCLPVDSYPGMTVKHLLNNFVPLGSRLSD